MLAVQAADLLDLLSNQSVSFQGPLVDLLPGQRVSIVHHRIGKEATITLVPVESGVTHGCTTLTPDPRRPAPASEGVLNQPPAFKQEGPNVEGVAYQGVLTSTADAATRTACAADQQQTVLVQHDGVWHAAASQADLASIAQAGPSGPADVVSGGSARQQLILVRNGQAVSLSSGQPLTRTLKAGDQTGDASSTSADQPRSESSGLQQVAFSDGVQSQAVLQNAAVSHQVAFTDGVQSQTVLQSAPGSHQVAISDGVQSETVLQNVAVSHQVAFSDGTQSQTVFQSAADVSHQVAFSDGAQSQTVLQSADVSHQVVLSDGFGQTQTLLLPPDFLKQEVVVIESEDGQQNVIDLSNVQIVHADDQHHVHFGDAADDSSRSSGPYQKFHILQSADGGDPMQVFQTIHTEASDQVCESSSSSSGGVVSISDGLSESCAVGQDAERDLGAESDPLSMSIYMCSTCNQQFDSMFLAEQHVLVDHAVDPAPVSSGSGGDGDVPMETEGEGRVVSVDEPETAGD